LLVWLDPATYDCRFAPFWRLRAGGPPAGKGKGRGYCVVARGNLLEMVHAILKGKVVATSVQL